MKLILSVRDAGGASGGTVVLDGRNALIGRSSEVDIHLPDPQGVISSRHCSIEFRNGEYLLHDISTNGTFLNGASQRLAAPHRLVPGDRLTIGSYQLEVLPDPVYSPPPPPPAAPAPPQSPPAPSGWDVPDPWASPAPASAWGLEPALAQPLAQPAPPPPVAPIPAAQDLWGKAPPLLGEPLATPVSARPPEGPGSATATLLGAAGLGATQPRGTEAQTLNAAGTLLRALVAGLMTMLAARRRAKSEMGAEATRFGAIDANPLKSARSPAEALGRLLDPFGASSPERAVTEAFEDLERHQQATLMAMQGALRVTLDRFSPDAIRGRAESAGLLARISPGGRERALWRAYENEFRGVATSSDGAFIDIFAREFKRAYDDQHR